MSFTFAAKDMQEDLSILASATTNFIEKRSIEDLKELARDLASAIARARSTGVHTFIWKTKSNAPIQISASKNWKGKTNNFDPLYAEISVDFDCSYLLASDRVRVNGGATVVTLKDCGNGEQQKVFHFDAEEGGWDGRAGHPPLHIQFSGFVNDIPRLPCIIVHPADVINFMIYELHQSHWREHVTGSQVRTKLRKFPVRQRGRLRTIAQRWAEALSDTSDHGLVILQRKILAPFDL
ncbi:hypothetical protein AB9F35_11225 [Rhizobium leguminosarum]|uniref:hypothetical protein n=1 Tax=Rhizobium leguminosarum TaxID=384 RepID=UPI003F9ABCC3